MNRHRSPWKLAFSLGLLQSLIPIALAGSELRDLRYVHPSLDGPPIVSTSPLDGTSWAAWAYRSQGEFDLALSSRDSSGLWSPPRFLGARDRLNQVEPSFAVDQAGNFYLAFAVREKARIYLSALHQGSAQWSPPVEVSLPGERASTPGLRIVGDRLVLGYRDGTRVVLRDFPLLGAVLPQGVQDGPDILPPLGDVPPGSGGGRGGNPPPNK
jgi:hypothetical protein